MQGIHILRHVRQVPRPHSECGNRLLQMVAEQHVEIVRPPRIDQGGLDTQEAGAALGSISSLFVIPAVKDHVMGCLACPPTPITNSHNTHTDTHTSVVPLQDLVRQPVSNPRQGRGVSVVRRMVEWRASILPHPHCREGCRTRHTTRTFTFASKVAGACSHSTSRTETCPPRAA
jgi:hypothetical protein